MTTLFALLLSAAPVPSGGGYPPPPTPPVMDLPAPPAPTPSPPTPAPLQDSARMDGDTLVISVVFATYPESYGEIRVPPRGE